VSGSETTTITADDLRDQLSAQDRARAADLPDRESDIDPDGAFQRRRDERIRGDRSADDRSRDEAFQQSRPDDVTPIGVTETEAGTTGSSTVGSTAAGPGTGALGTLDTANDPTRIGNTGFAGRNSLDPAQLVGVADESSAADTVSETNDPSGIAPGVTDQLGDGRLGGGTLPSDVTGTDTATGTDSGTATQTDTDTGVGTGSGTGTSTGGGTDTPQTTPITDPTGGTSATTDATTRSAASAASFDDSGNRRPRTPELPELFGGESDDNSRDTGQDSFTFGFDPEVGIFGEDL